MAACLFVQGSSEERKKAVVEPAMEQLIIRVDGLAARLGTAWPFKIMQFYQKSKGMTLDSAERVLEEFYTGELFGLLKERVGGSVVYCQGELMAFDRRGDFDFAWYPVKVVEGWRPEGMMEFLLKRDNGLEIHRVPLLVAQLLIRLWYLVAEEHVFKFSMEQGVVKALVFPLGNRKGEYEVKVMLVEG